MPSLLEPYEEEMQGGDYSDAIEGPGGFHIINLYETRGQE